WLAMMKLCGPSGAPSIRGRTPATRVAATRKRLGQRERPRSHFVRTWIGASVKKRKTRPAMRKPAMIREGGDSTLAVNGDAVEFHAMVDEPEAEPLGDALLKQFQLFIDEFD